MIDTSIHLKQTVDHPIMLIVVFEALFAISQPFLSSYAFISSIIHNQRCSSEYKTSDSDQKVNQNIYSDAVTRDTMHLVDPKSGHLEPIHHCCLFKEL